MSLYFNDSTQDVIFQLDVHFGIVLIGNVEEFGVEVHELILEAGDLPERRFGHQLNDGRLSSIDCGSNTFAGKKGRKNFKGFTVIAVGFFAVVSHVNFCLKEHKFFDRVHDSGELIFAGFGVSVVDLTGEPAIDDTGRDVAIADVVFGDSDAENIEVKLLYGF